VGRRASRNLVQRTAITERIAAVAGAGGVVVIAAEAGTGKRVLADQALEQLGDADVAVHDADRHDAGGAAALGRAIATRDRGSGVIVVARRDPGLCLEEPVRGEPVLELDGADLAWSEAEVAEGLERWGVAADAERLTRLTEGWCQAVRLGAFVGEHALAPASAPLADYLFADALRDLPPEHLHTLLRLSFADAFDGADVARVLGGDVDGEQTLDALRRRRAFLRPAASGRFRVHRLVAAVARRRLTIEDPAAARTLRGRRPAPEPDPGLAVDAVVADPLLAAHAWELLLDGRLTRPSPAALAVARTGGKPTSLAAALALLAVGDARRGAPLLVPRADPEAPVRDPVRLLALLMAARLDGDSAAVERHANALERLPDVPDGLRAIAAIEQGILAHDLGTFIEAERRLTYGAGLAGHAARPAVLARARGALALCCVGFGRLREGVRHAETALAELAERLPDGRVRALLALGLGAYLRDELVEAAELMLRARQAAAQTRDDSLWGLVLLYDAIVAESLGEYDRARFTLAEARATEHPVAKLRSPLMDLVHVRQLDHIGRADEAARLAAALPRTMETDLIRARLLLAAHRPSDAITMLGPWIARSAPASSHPGRVTWHLVTFALAAAAVHDDAAAHAALERALDLAAMERLRRPFAEERARLRPLLERHGVGSTKHGAFVRELLARDGTVDHAATSDAMLRTSLTDRERMVLGYLPSTMTAADIAFALRVSEATVRTHLRHIYEKLGATGRRDAVERARRTGLVA
jgi:LuxR family transcriptional regulator, maltose regulon positive regulatory protein